MTDTKLAFTIDDDLKANWAIKKIGEHQRNIYKIEDRRDSFIADYNARIEEAKKNCDEECDAEYRAIDFLVDKLRDFAANHLPDNKRTLKFPEGNLKFIKTSPKFLFDDGSEPSANSQQLINYLQKTNPDFIKSHIRYSADWTNFKRQLSFDSDGKVFNSNTGELINELHALPSNDKFLVIPKELPDEN